MKKKKYNLKWLISYTWKTHQIRVSNSFLGQKPNKVVVI